MKICRVKPDKNTCCSCLDRQLNQGVLLDCEMCQLNLAEYELLSAGTALFKGDYAMILNGEKIEKVPLKRVYAVREVPRASFDYLTKRYTAGDENG